MIEIYSRATASTATHFLDKLERRAPLPLKAVQVDGGSEFEAVFEEECQRRNIKLFILPPRSPKLNGHVERAHRTHPKEFCEVTESYEVALIPTSFFLDREGIIRAVNIGAMTKRIMEAKLAEAMR